MKKVVATLTLGILALVHLTPGSAAEHGYTCTLSGAASFKPGLTSGDDAFGQLVFDADVTKCNTDEGLTEAEFSGQVGGGSPS